MKKVIAKLTKTELNQLIAEEYANLKKVVSLKAKKEAIQKEIKQLKESYGLSEVEVSGHKDKGDAYFMKGLPVQKFEKKGTHLKEMDLDDEEMDTEMDTEMGEEECGEIESMLRDLGRKLDALVDGNETPVDAGMEDMEDMGGDEEELEVDMGGDEEELEVDEQSQIPVAGGDDSFSEEDIVSDEDDEDTIDEQDGETVVNAAKEDTVNDNMSKVDNKNAEADKLYEGAGKGRGSRLNPKGSRVINEELQRMRKLANLI